MDALRAKYLADSDKEEGKGLDAEDLSLGPTTVAGGAGEASEPPRRRQHRNKAEEMAHKIRESFYVLSQGVDVMQYQGRGRRSDKVRQVLWLEPDILRVCIDSRRLTATDHLNGKTAPGLYLRDIAEVRAGASAHLFKYCTTPPADKHCCLSLIGTERTVCLEFPSRESRDWLLERLRLVLEDVLSTEEISERRSRSRRHNHNVLATLSTEEMSAATQMMALLKRGIQILHHNKAGRVVRSSVFYDQAEMRLEVKPADLTLFGQMMASVVGTGGATNVPASLHMSDIVEIRLGSHSYGFVASDSTDKGPECMSIVGTEGTLDLQLATSNARDLFAAKLRIFIRFWELHIAEDVSEDEEDEGGADRDNAMPDDASARSSTVAGETISGTTILEPSERAGAVRPNPHPAQDNSGDGGGDDVSIEGLSIKDSLSGGYR